MMGNEDLEKYEVLETIGRGSFGTIRKVKRTSDGHVLCRKEIQYIKMSQKEREQLHAEFSILNSLKHPNIVGYYHREHLKPTQELFLYMEYCGGGDLSKEIQKLRDRNQYADEEYVWGIFTQLVAALYRCHYGVNAPDTTTNVTSRTLGLRTKNAVMILHRDLKPENVFLGADNSVKLGDFGLSKLMQSHDFASTYVGTPFYMSPEICAAERYTLHSDIWSLGCVMYELCARTQPFNAKTHFHLIQKIKEGRIDPLPSHYSTDLQNAIKSCLNVNPSKRPDTATLLNLPAMRMVRREREMVELGRMLKDKEEHARLKVHSAEVQLAKATNMRAELEASLRREWELKAGLEISRQVQLEKDRLARIFKTEVELRVKTELELRLHDPHLVSPPNTNAENTHLSVASTCAEEFPSQLSPETKSKTPPRRRVRGPLSRARTQLDSPMDVPMNEPSPLSIASLSLSPRRGETKETIKTNSNNIFAQAVKSRLNVEETLIDAEEEEDDLPDLPSPTRPLVMPRAEPCKQRPTLLRQKTLPVQRLGPPALFRPTAAERPARVPSPPSPKRAAFSPNRRAPPRPGAGEPEMLKSMMQRNLLTQPTGGRTLVELAQAKAGLSGGPARTEKGLDAKENIPVWDPATDEMPSPFLVRSNKAFRR